MSQVLKPVARKPSTNIRPRPASPASQPRSGVPLDKRYKLEQIADILRQEAGYIAQTAVRLGCERNTLGRLIARTPYLQEITEEARETILDRLEESAHARAMEGDTALTIFLLKTLGRRRGYEQEDKPVRDIATAAFEFVINQSKSPVHDTNTLPLTLDLQPYTQAHT